MRAFHAIDAERITPGGGVHVTALILMVANSGCGPLRRLNRESDSRRDKRPGQLVDR
jgi:hypothetical protein